MSLMQVERLGMTVYGTSVCIPFLVFVLFMGSQSGSSDSRFRIVGLVLTGLHVSIWLVERLSNNNFAQVGRSM